MTIDEIKVLDAAGIETRMSEIKAEMEVEGADFEALNAEVDAIEQRKAEIKASNTAFAELRNKVADTAKTIEHMPKENEKMDIMELRNSQNYVDAFARYIRTGKDAELRSILTENAAGENDAVLPVPSIVEQTIKHAWDDMKILSRVTRTTLKGNVKVGVETEADDAVIHAEGAAAIDEEELTLKIVTMVPATIKKYITVSDEVLDMDNGAFLQYIYNEIAYKIFKKAEDTVVADIVADADSLGSVVAPTGAVTDFINALAKLSDEADNPVVIINKESYSYYKGLQLAAGYAIDVFDGMTVLFNNTLKPVTSTTLAAGAYGIVGDLKGEQVNFPNGTDVTFKFDDLSMAEKDLVKIVGRLPMGHAVVAPKRFTVLKK